MNQEPEMNRHRPWVKVALVAFAFAVVVTTVGWLIAGKGPPINQGVSPDVHDRPLLMVWVVANFPAAILFVNVFSKLGSEAQYFLCVFLQWLVVGIPIGLLGSLARRPPKEA
jgi:hypothetical protein